LKKRIAAAKKNESIFLEIDLSRKAFTMDEAAKIIERAAAFSIVKKPSILKNDLATPS
jgi:hypothetical protein